MKQATKLLILITVVVWIAWDLYTYHTLGNPSTISATIWRWSWNIPGIPFGIGILIGHLLFQMHEPTAFPDSVVRKAEDKHD